MPGVGPVHQHLFVMIGLDDERPASPEFFGQEAGDDAEVGRMPVAPLSRVYDEAERVDRIVGGLKRVYADVAKGERVLRFEFDDAALVQQFFHCFPGPVADEHRYFQLSCQGACPAGMVGVIVADQDAVYRGCLHADERQTLQNLGRREPGIDDEPGPAGFDVDSITFAPTCKQADLQWFLR